MATEKSCEFCKSQELAFECPVGHGICSYCTTSYLRAHEKLCQSDVRCPEYSCLEPMKKTAADEKSGTARPLAQLVELKTESEEYNEAVVLFSKSMDRSSIEKVYRVHNEGLAGMFLLCQDRLRKETRPLNERLLFHATDRRNLGSIIRGGFDIRRAGTAHGTALGLGIYMAEDAKFADGYSRKDISGSRCMFICRCLLGKSGSGALCDSRASSGQHVIRREQQILPLYVVYYRWH